MVYKIVNEFDGITDFFCEKCYLQFTNEKDARDHEENCKVAKQ